MFKTIVQAFKVKEGNLTMQTTQGVGGDITRPQVANPVLEGDPVKIAGDLLFVKCSAGDTPIAYAHAAAKRLQVAFQRGFACVVAFDFVRFRTLDWPHTDAHLGARRATHNRAH